MCTLLFNHNAHSVSFSLFIYFTTLYLLYTSAQFIAETNCSNNKLVFVLSTVVSISELVTLELGSFISCQ